MIVRLSPLPAFRFPHFRVVIFSFLKSHIFHGFLHIALPSSHLSAFYPLFRRPLIFVLFPHVLQVLIQYKLVILDSFSKESLPNNFCLWPLVTPQAFFPVICLSHLSLTSLLLLNVISAYGKI